MNLYIDSTDNLKTVIKIDNHELIKNYDSPREQNILVIINEVLKKNKLSLKDISTIEVNPGPGSFTGTRVGVAIANTLAFALGIKVNGHRPPIEPVYTEPPHITQRKVDSTLKKV